MLNECSSDITTANRESIVYLLDLVLYCCSTLLFPINLRLDALFTTENGIEIYNHYCRTISPFGAVNICFIFFLRSVVSCLYVYNYYKPSWSIDPFCQYIMAQHLCGLVNMATQVSFGYYLYKISFFFFTFKLFMSLELKWISYR